MDESKCMKYSCSLCVDNMRIKSFEQHSGNDTAYYERHARGNESGGLCALDRDRKKLILSRCRCEDRTKVSRKTKYQNVPHGIAHKFWDPCHLLLYGTLTNVPKHKIYEHILCLWNIHKRNDAYRDCLRAPSSRTQLSMNCYCFFSLSISPSIDISFYKA